MKKKVILMPFLLLIMLICSIGFYMTYAHAEEPVADESGLEFQGGLQVGTKPDYVTDDKVTFLNLKDHGKPLNPVGTVDHPAFSNVKDTTLPDLEIYDSNVKMIRAKNLVFTLSFENADEIVANDYSKFEMNMFWSDWSFNSHDIYIYGSGTEKFLDEGGNPVGFASHVRATGPQTPVDVIINDVSLLADNNGVVKHIFIMYGGNVKDADGVVNGTANGSQPWINTIKFSIDPLPQGSIRYEAGNLGMNKPDYITDKNVTYQVGMRNHGQPHHQYGYVNNPAFATINSENYPDFEVYDFDNKKAIKAQKILFVFNVQPMVASNYAQFQLTFCWTDWLFGTHQFYLYPSGTTTFTDESGNPVGYADEMKVRGTDAKQKFEINDMSKLQDERGKITDIILLYWGNVRDDGENIIGTSLKTEGDASTADTQIFVNEINFIVEEDVKHPEPAEQYITKDISEIFPVGNGWTTELKSKGVTDENADNYGEYTLVTGASISGFDQLNFKFTPTYTDNFSTILMIKSTSDDKDWTKGGIAFWFSDDKLIAGGSNGESITVSTVGKENFPDGAFASGKETTVSIKAIPCYIDGVLNGYQLSVVLNNSETPVVFIYVELKDLSLGNYVKFIHQDLGKDFSIKYAPVNDMVKTPAEIMSVGLKSSKTEYDKPRASLTLVHKSFLNESVSDMIIDGNATFDKGRNMLNFEKGGTVKVSYKVTNPFGEFESNVLELKYTDPDGGGGCGSQINGNFIVLGIVLLSAVVVLIIDRKIKNNK